MQHKLLLGSTALVSAGILISGAAQAQETIGGLEVQLGGYTEFGGKAGQSLNSRADRGYFFFMDNEVFINANGANAIAASCMAARSSSRSAAATATAKTTTAPPTPPSTRSRCSSRAAGAGSSLAATTAPRTSWG